MDHGIPTEEVLTVRAANLADLLSGRDSQGAAVQPLVTLPWRELWRFKGPLTNHP
jgi:hypothetical protein